MAEDTCQYIGYGLNIESCIRLPELESVVGGRPDVTIRYGAVPRTLVGARAKGNFYQASPGSLLLLVHGVARYLVTDGKQIVIEREPNVEDEVVRLFLLGTAVAALLHQRGFLPIHCSAIALNDCSVAFAGPSGSGKSTLALAFLKRGYPIMTDDVGVVSADEHGMPILHPGYPQLKLWTDTVEVMGEEWKCLEKIRPEVEKFRRPIVDEFYRKSLPLRHLYVLGVADTEEFELYPVTGAEKVAEIIVNTCHVGFLEGLGNKPQHFRQCHAVARNISVSRLIRPREPFMLNELIELLDADFPGQTVSLIETRT